MSRRETSAPAWRSTVGVVVLFVLVVGCRSKAPSSAAASTSLPSATTTAPSAVASSVVLAAGQVGTRDQVPWDEVGPGWFLVQSDADPDGAPSPSSPASPPAPDGGNATLLLVSPPGGRYVIATWPGHGAGSTPLNAARLVAWSGDGRRALLNDLAHSVAVEIDVKTGALREISVPQMTMIGFTSPQGAGLIAAEDVGAPDQPPTGERLVRLNLDGGPQIQLAEVDSGSIQWLYSPDGAAVYLNGAGGLRVVSNDGGPVRDLAMIEKGDGCDPVAWWEHDTILASCSNRAGFRLWLVPVSNGSAAPLTAPPGRQPVGLGYLSAVRAGDSVFAEHFEACGEVAVQRLAPTGVGTRIAFAQSQTTDYLIGPLGSKIAVISSPACAGPAWFGFYDPATNATQKIVPEGPDGLGVIAALAFP